MNLREAVGIALGGLRANRLRSALTMLGIIVGVAAVVPLAAIGNGVQASVNAEVQPLANLIAIMPSTRNVPGGSTPTDLIDGDGATLQRQLIDDAAAIPAVTSQALVETDTTKFRFECCRLHRMLAPDEQPRYPGEVALRPGSGPLDRQSRGDRSYRRDHPVEEAALRQTIRINHQTLKIIGVMQTVGEPADNQAMMPLKTACRYIFGGGDKLNQITVRASLVIGLSPVDILPIAPPDFGPVKLTDTNNPLLRRSR
jgi:putative ABC transport system permease protein